MISCAMHTKQRRHKANQESLYVLHYAHATPNYKRRRIEQKTKTIFGTNDETF